MRIEPTRVNGLVQRPVGEVGRAEVETSRPAQGVAQTDQVILSQRASEVQVARDALGSVPQVRARKVAELKRQIQTGTYQVNADAVADKIIGGSGAS
jgi:negative regulator of flagellin synthesis FlgM